MFFGLTGLIGFYLGAYNTLDRINDPPYYCRKDRFDQPVIDPEGRGTYEECLEWAPSYHAIVLTFLSLLTAYG